MIGKWVLLALCGVLVLDPATGRAVNLAGCLELSVSVTVSSLTADLSVPRQLQLTYWNAEPEPGDYVGLYDAEPSATSQPLAVLSATAEDGHTSSTGVEAPWIVSTQLTYTADCLGYWAAYVRGAEILAVSCLKNQPTWMWDNRAAVGGMKLREIFLAGTHDSSAYHNYSENVVNKYTYTQEEDILSQLVAGIRYVDMRVSYVENSASQWWTNHGPVLLHPLSEITRHVRDFLENTDEIVIFDLHSLTGFGPTTAVHEEFVAWLTAELGEHMTPSSLTWDTTLDAVWATGRRLILTYPQSQVVSAHDTLWSIVLHQWGDVQDVDALYQYLSGVMASHPAFDPWSSMVQLTARASDLVTDELGGLRQMAHAVGYNVTEWYRGEWGETVNIVAADFFRGTYLVEEAIEWNLRRSAGISC